MSSISYDKRENQVFGAIHRIKYNSWKETDAISNKDPHRAIHAKNTTSRDETTTDLALEEEKESEESEEKVQSESDESGEAERMPIPMSPDICLSPNNSTDTIDLASDDENLLSGHVNSKFLVYYDL